MEFDSNYSIIKNQLGRHLSLYVILNVFCSPKNLKIYSPFLHVLKSFKTENQSIIFISNSRFLPDQEKNQAIPCFTTLFDLD